MTPDTLPISALQHLLYCERQCALIHLEREWAENRFTAEGRVLHERAHDGPDESRPGLRITRGLPVRGELSGLHGVCDVVEFHADGRVVPVEYKRGKPKAHRADEVQVCAQALCLEETLGIAIAEAHLFYGTTRRRTVVPLDATLRALTASLAARLRQLLAAEVLPVAIYERRKCGACSLIETCQPRATRPAAAWFQKNLTASLAASTAETS